MDAHTTQRLLVRPEDRVDPSRPGAAWWRYQRPDLPGDRPAPAAPEPLAEGSSEAPAPGEAPAPRKVPGPRDGWQGPASSGAYAAVVIPCLLAAVVISARAFGVDHLGMVVFPVVGLVGAVAFGNRCRRLRPDEPWLPRLILLGTIVKLGAVLTRYVTFDVFYNRVGDAYVYDREGRELVAYWLGDRTTDPMAGLALTGSNFLRWLTGVVYLVFGQNLLAAFFLFGLLAFVGTYFWYRAFADAVPFVDKRLFLIIMLFAPSVIFWPGSLGKEALMQVSLGALAWATSLVLRGRFVHAVPLALGGGVLTYVLRPHLLALATVASVVPIFVGRMRGGSERSITNRPALMVLGGLAVVFTVTAGLKFVGVESLSIDAVEAQLDYQTQQTSYGGSAFSHPGNSLTNPLYLPFGFVTVVFRPFPFEAHGVLPLLASVESTVLMAIILRRLGSIRTAFTHARRHPFLLYSIMLIILYSATLSSLANFGLISRQRSLVLPAVYALICVIPQPRRRREAAPDEEVEHVLVPFTLPPAMERTLGNGAGHPNGSGNGHQSGSDSRRGQERDVVRAGRGLPGGGGRDARPRPNPGQ